MKFSKVGIEGGRLLLTQDSVFFFDTRRAVLRAGPASSVRTLIPVPVSSSRLFQNMLGLIAPPRKQDWSLQSDSSYYYLSASSTNVQYVVDPKRWRVVRYQKTTPEGTVLQKRLFSDFRPVDGVQMPHQLIFRRPNAELSAVVNYRQITLNPSRLSLDLEVPPEVPRTSFR